MQVRVLIRIQGYVINFGEKNLKMILEKNNFLKKVSFLNLLDNNGLK